MTVQHRPNTFLDTSTDTASAQWDDLLNLQVDLFLPQELDYLRHDPVWHSASDVLDVGCGNGYYLSRLQSFFPAKSYVGMDVSPELIRVAEGAHARQGIRFYRKDFFNDADENTYDVILLRFVLQHLSDFPAILAGAERRLRFGGSLFVIEPSLAESETWPPTPLFLGVFEAFERRQAELGRLRMDVGRIGGLVDGRPGWSVTRESVVSVPGIGPFAGSKTMAAFGRWVDLCERAAGFDYPFAAVRAEIAEWGRNPSAFSRIVLRVVRLTYAGGRS
ncbi:MAG: class I SAM-dependent methyltransferase [Bauldia sp.]